MIKYPKRRITCLQIWPAEKIQHNLQNHFRIRDGEDALSQLKQRQSTADDDEYRSCKAATVVNPRERVATVVNPRERVATVANHACDGGEPKRMSCDGGEPSLRRW
ncbi:hypothetical protein CISIN_1g034036mg [Citrus sinensis]|uniref:Uncharacterized protein n=1 Tax=Citrus sinensis TaxID=2711 RepID=A0A067EEV7_CITSI|nr:hypothetical protein CISIN_1g034036mg [Citrus sinensis]